MKVRSRSRIIAAAALVALAACGEAPSAPDAAAISPTATARYLVRLDPDALGAMPREAVRDARFAAYHPAPAVHLVRAVEREHGASALAMTSLTGLTFTADLTPDQAAALAWDPRVQSVDADRPVEFSSDATAVWPDDSSTGVGSEHFSWGARAVSSGLAPGMRVYVIDGGVTPSSDLNVALELNANCAPVTPGTPCPSPPPVMACYQHSTHVAGIIGALSGNAMGVRGVAAGAPIVSISTLDPAHRNGTGCLTDPAGTMTGIVAALEWVASDALSRNSVGIANISSNNAAFQAGQPLGIAMINAATPNSITGYKGTFIAESAGNGNATDVTNACNVSYSATNSYDGIMVVGMINDHGQQVRPLNGIFGERNMPYASDEPGSNYGPCIEAWAPGRSIFSTFGGGYQYLSGTSMAAPHVAGLAARLADSTSTSRSLEQLVHQHLMVLGSYDNTPAALGGPQPIAIPTLAPLGTYVAHSTPYAEVAVARGSLAGATPGAPLELYAVAEPFLLGFEMIGSGTCDLNRRNGTAAPIAVASIAAGAHAPISETWPVGTWTVYSNACPSAATTVTIDAKATPRWFVGTADQTGATVTVAMTPTSPIHYKVTDAVGACTWAAGDLNNYGATVLQGSGTAADVTVGLPAAAGNYRYSVQCHDHGPQNATATLTVTLTAPPPPPVDNAQFVSQSGVPATVTPGQTFSASLTFKNTGNTTWTRAQSYRLGSASPLDNTRWGTNRVDLATADSIAPNASKTFTATFTAPTAAGTYAFQWELVHDGVGAFGALSTSVSVVDAAAGGGGVCTPGDTESCCPCSGGCGCTGDMTCNSAGQWGGCGGYVCKPGHCN